MKFSKELLNNIQKYKNYIPKEHWFNYKMFKKKLKHLVLEHYLLIHQRNLLNSKDNLNDEKYKTHMTNNEYDECCICLESSNLMKTFCCHNYIHHHCLVHTFTYAGMNCPLCRTPIQESIKFNPQNEQESLDAGILSLISCIHLEMMRIHHICNNQLKESLISRHHILKQFYNINMLAVTKICKKIDKQLHINIKPYFLNIIEKQMSSLTFHHDKEKKCSFCTIV